MEVSGTTVDMLRQRGDTLSLDAAQKIMDLRESEATLQSELAQAKGWVEKDNKRCRKRIAELEEELSQWRMKVDRRDDEIERADARTDRVAAQRDQLEKEAHELKTATMQLVGGLMAANAMLGIEKTPAELMKQFGCYDLLEPLFVPPGKEKG